MGDLVRAPEWTDAVAVLPDRRRIGYCAYGDPNGLPVLHFHGALTSRFEGFWLHVAAKQHGIKLFTLDRPGVGNSDYSHNRQLLDWPKDVAAFADVVGLAKFSVLGVSGGGPYALACAHELPQRVTRVSLIAGAAPLHNPAVFALMSLRQRVVLGTLIHKPALLHPFLKMLRSLPNFLRVFAVGATLGGLSPADLAIIRRADMRARFQELPSEAYLAPFGADASGPAWDGHLHSQPWGFELKDITMPVDLWYAEDDRIVPARMGRYLAGVLPNTHAHFLPMSGHLDLILGKADEFLGTLKRDLTAA